MIIKPVYISCIGTKMGRGMLHNPVPGTVLKTIAHVMKTSLKLIFVFAGLL